ncbi:GNAT family N-acetyltransferase [Alteribacter aurantiacus]|uniref:GNAT family N-acetyltransferase n=1 Tax=Alteribacter aurantiacus TaxID=254410 RepID=UPI000687DF20|nr:GNAT family N-acetyltransferase [Alteribacter aurantiacus]
MIRTYRAEDKDYIINSHYELYHREFKYDLSFRDFVLKSIGGFIERGDPHENIFILDVNGKPSGSISIKKHDDTTAQLGLFLVEPVAQGTGYGQKLVEKAITFSKEKGYNRIILWTNGELKAARKIYIKMGFELRETKTSFLSNQEIIEEKWERLIKGISG